MPSENHQKANNMITIAAIQMVSSTNPITNINTMQKLVRQAAEQGAQWVLLPEYWAIMGHNEHDKCQIAEPLGKGILQDALAQVAEQCRITLFAGSIPLVSENPPKIHNALLTFNPQGKCIAHYNKMHLFGYSGLGERYSESDTIQAGQHIPCLEIDDWKIAQGICYDIRFPEFFRAQAPFDLILLPAAFTHTTGKAHWELLLRTRAIENQSYLIAAGQGGQHENGRRTWGHSMIIDPWGDILAELDEGEGIITAQLEKTRLNSVRERLPALKHRLL